MTDSRLERSLTLLRDQGFRAIHEGSKGSLERIFASHADFIGFYLDARSRFKVKLASRDISLAGLAGYESRPVFLILESLDELIRRTFGSNDPDLIDVALRSLLSTEILVLERSANSLYRVLLARLQTALILAIKIDDSKLRHRILSRILLGQKELIQYRAIYDLLQRPNADIESLVNFTKELIRTLNLPMKMALEARAVREFNHFVDSLAQIFEPGYHEPSEKLMEIEAKITFGRAVGSDLSALRESKAKLERQKEFFAAVGDYQRIMLLGAGGWATNLFDSGKLSEREFSEVFEKILPTMLDLETLTQVYLKATGPDSDREFGWSFWELDIENTIRGANQAWQMDSGESWLNKFYVLAGIRLPSGAPAIDGLVPLINEHMLAAQTLEQFGQTIRTIGREYVAASEKWGAVVPELRQLQLQGGDVVETVVQKIERISSLWDQLGARVRADEEQAILRADVAGIEGFATKFRDSWIKTSLLRTRVTELGAYDDLTNQDLVPKGTPKLGFNILQQKRWFIQGSEFAASSIAELLGNRMAELETDATYERILSAFKPGLVTSEEELLRRLEDFLESLNPEVLRCYTIITDFRDKLGVEFYKSAHFRYPSDRTAGIQYWGYLKGIPILTLWRRGGRVAKPSLVCVDLCKLGRWRQFHAGEVGGDLSISIRAIDDDGARELLRANPQLLLHESGRELTPEERLSELCRRVQIQISQCFAFEIVQPDAGIRFDYGAADV